MNNINYAEVKAQIEDIEERINNLILRSYMEDLSAPESADLASLYGAQDSLMASIDMRR